jgi:hypothetical protein
MGKSDQGRALGQPYLDGSHAHGKHCSSHVPAEAVPWDAARSMERELSSVLARVDVAVNGVPYLERQTHQDVVVLRKCVVSGAPAAVLGRCLLDWHVACPAASPPTQGALQVL